MVNELHFMLNRFLFIFIFFSTCCNFVGAQSFFSLLLQQITKKEEPFISEFIFLTDLVENIDNYSADSLHQNNAEGRFLSNVMNNLQYVSRKAPWLECFEKFVEMIFAKESATSLYMQANALSSAKCVPSFLIEWLNQFVEDQLHFSLQQEDPSKTILAPVVVATLVSNANQQPGNHTKSSNPSTKKLSSNRRSFSVDLEQQECGICLEVAHKKVVGCPAAQCKSSFCESCLTDWLKRSKSCPGCRGEKK